LAKRCAEFDAEFRADLETFLSTEALEAVIVPGRFELPRIAGVTYFAFCDPSGGRGDAMTLSCCHKDGERLVQDCIRIQKPPFDPASCVKEFAEVLKCYGITQITGDKYSGEWCASAFLKEGIQYRNSELTKSVFAGIADVPPTPHQVLHRIDAKPPATMNMEADQANAREAAVDAAFKKYNCNSRAQAWEFAQRDNSQLFIS
jgi:hypothetical protein